MVHHNLLLYMRIAHIVDESDNMQVIISLNYLSDQIHVCTLLMYHLIISTVTDFNV